MSIAGLIGSKFEMAHSDHMIPLPSVLDLGAWRDALPSGYRILGANCFADFFVADETGRVHMLEIAAASISQICDSENQFWLDLVHDQEGWLLRPLGDRCRNAGLGLPPDSCYAFKTFPIFGGLYEVANIFVCPLDQWLSVMGEVYQSIKDLPDGAEVKIQIVD